MFNHPFKRLCVCLLAAGLIIFPCGQSAARAETLHQEVSSPTLSMERISIGYDGIVTYSKKMPVTVTLSNTGADLTGVLAVNVYVNREQYSRYELPVTLAGGARRQLTLPISIATKQDRYTVEFVSQGQVLCAQNISPARTISPDTLLVGVLSAAPAALSYLNITVDNDPLLRGETWQTVPLTRETFPAQEQLLRSFGLLVVDGFDAATLSADQLSALDGWLRGGGVLLLGGGAQAATVYPAFSAYTGISAGALTPARDITPALTGFLGLTDAPLGEETLLTSLRGGQALISDGETPLLMRAAVGSGLIYTAAFELGIKPLSAWPLMHSFFQRLLLKDAPEAYQTLLDLNHYTQSEGYLDTEFMSRYIPVENQSSAVPMLVLLALYLGLGGVGGYFLLKKLDKREWLWGLFPALTVLCVAGIALLGQGGGFSQPMAAAFTHYNLDRPDGGKTYVAVTCHDGDEHLISADADVALINNDSYNYYGYDDESELSAQEPTKLLYRYVLGDHTNLGVNFGAPWTLKYVSLTGGAAQAPLDVRATIWPEADGLHGKIENQTEFALNQGVVLTSLGFCSLPDIGPGESAEFSLLENTGAKTIYFTDGVLATGLEDSGYYSLINAYLYPEDQQGNFNYSSLSPDELSARQAKQSQLSFAFSDDERIYYSSNTFFRFVAFNDTLNAAPLSLDGVPVARTANRGMISRALTFEPVGPDGQVYYVPGLLEPTLADAEGDKPRDTGEKIPANISGFRLVDRPAFCFSVPEMEKLEIESLRLEAISWGYAMETLLYNQETGQWDARKPGETLSGAQAAPYLKDGALYAQFGPGPGADSYSEVQKPTLEIRGKVK